MVHNKATDAASIVEQAAAFTEDLIVESSSRSPDGAEDNPLEVEFLRLEVYNGLSKHFEERTRPTVEVIRALGGTWARIAAALRLATASSAHWLYGRGKEERKGQLRERVAEQRAQVDRKPLPGISALEASKVLGLDPRTVKGRGERGEIRTVTVKNRKGNDSVRYILENQEAPAAETNA